MYQDSMIVFTSDHGCHFRTRNMEYKRSCHEASIRIPLVIKGPSFSEGKVIKELVSLIDLPPTLLEAARIQIPEFMKGNMLQTLVNSNDNNNNNNNQKDWPQEVFIQISESQIGRAIRTKKWKYSIAAPPHDLPWAGMASSNSEVYKEEFLYDLENDLHEKHNLVEDPTFKDIRKQLAKTLIRKMNEAGEKIPDILLK
jgi:arylsulfatase A-like enzyme